VVEGPRGGKVGPLPDVRVGNRGVQQRIFDVASSTSMSHSGPFKGWKSALETKVKLVASVGGGSLKLGMGELLLSRGTL